MTTNDTDIDGPVTRNQLHGGGVRVPRSRGALSGIMLIVLGAWGALIPFIGPYFNFSYRPDTAWHWTAARGWLELLPGIVAFVGGVLTLMSSNRVMILFGAWLGVLAGAWFVIGRDIASWLKIGSPGTPAGTGTTVQTFEALALFSGLGALIIFFGANAVGRLSVRSVHDVRAAQKRETRKQKAEREVHDSAYDRGHRDGLSEAQNEHGRFDEQRQNTTTGAPTTAPNAPTTQQQPAQGGYPPAGSGYGQPAGYPAAPPEQGASSATPPPQR
jgi:hypothetical protein